MSMENIQKEGRSGFRIRGSSLEDEIKIKGGKRDKKEGTGKEEGIVYKIKCTGCPKIYIGEKHLKRYK